MAARLRIGVPGDIRVRAQLATGVPELTALLRILTPGETRVRAELRTGVPEVTARLRATMAAPDPGKTLYGVVYTVTDEADRSDASSFIWTICPAIRIQAHLATGVPELTARLRVATPAAPQPDDAVTDGARRAAAPTARRRTSSSSLPPDDEQLFPLAAKLGQVANFEAAWFLGRPAFLADVSVPRSFELVPNPGEVDEVNVNKGRALPPPVHEDADYLV